MKKNVKKTLKNNKKPLIIGAIGAGTIAVVAGLGKAFADMKKSARAQHELDKAEFEAAKAEARASFEENRGRNTYQKAKADAKQVWDEAHMTAAERAEKDQEARCERLKEAKARTEAANARCEAAKKN